ncbi:DUF3222 family protein [Candidatus Dojkabacteria bacterium]|jgi:hypothetical protein|nr:DUF3222 family protein [Candidatus Dojkabacteria bacterium]
MAILDEQREKDIQAMCDRILNMYVEDTGDHGMGGRCPLCHAECCWDDGLDNIEHKPDCIYLIAKDLSTNLK